MGFAFVVQMTKCDVHLVKLLSAPLSKLGLLLIPAATAITYFICIAIPSAAGCAAAVGPTMIPLLRRAGVSPVSELPPLSSEGRSDPCFLPVFLTMPM